MVARKAIRLRLDDVEVLKALYRAKRVPRDQYRNRPQERAELVAEFNEATGLAVSADELMHFIYVQQKRGQKGKYHPWPTFAGDHVKPPDLPPDTLSRREWNALNILYDRLFLSREVGSDRGNFDEGLAAELSREFAKATGRSLSGAYLVRLLIAERKRKQLPTLRPQGDDLNFSDIDEVA